MKFFIIIYLFYNFCLEILSQYGSLKLDSKPNEQFQLTPQSLFTANTSSKTLKKLYSLVNTPQFIISSQNPPITPDNIKYTETDKEVIYIIELPHFPLFITKNDLIFDNGISGLSIIAKNSGLYHNDAFFPDLTEGTINSIVKTKDYRLDLRFFRRLKSKETPPNIKINEKPNNSFEIIVTIDKKNLEPQPFLRKLTDLSTQPINTVVFSNERIAKIKEKFKKPFIRAQRLDPLTGLEMEVFKKGEINENKDLSQILKEFIKEGDENPMDLGQKHKNDLLKNEEYTEKNMDEKIAKKKEADRKESEENLKENLQKTEEMQRKLENEEEYEYND